MLSLRRSRVNVAQRNIERKENPPYVDVSDVFECTLFDPAAAVCKIPLVSIYQIPSVTRSPPSLSFYDPPPYLFHYF